jgi:signal transduction histidine kinase
LRVPSGILEQVFDPFFTTKPVGLATGLGLSICHNIVTGMGGQISATSRGGPGRMQHRRRRRHTPD